MKITVKSVANKDNFSLDLEPDASISALKKEICKMREIDDPMLIRLVYAGSVLENDNVTLNQLGYKEKEYMVMVKRKTPALSSPTQPVATQLESKSPQATQPLSDISNVNNKPADVANVNNAEPVATQVANSFNVYHPQLSPDQIQQLHNILENDQAVQEFLTQYPNMREHLQDPEVLIELLRRVGHPIVDEMPDLHRENNPENGVQVVHVTPEEADELTEIRETIASVMGEIPLTEMQLNSLVYQGYNMMGKNKDATIAFLLNQLMDM